MLTFVDVKKIVSVNVSRRHFRPKLVEMLLDFDVDSASMDLETLGNDFDRSTSAWR